MSSITDIPEKEDLESLRLERDQLRDEVQRLKVSCLLISCNCKYLIKRYQGFYFFFNSISTCVLCTSVFTDCAFY